LVKKEKNICQTSTSAKQHSSNVDLNLCCHLLLPNFLIDYYYYYCYYNYYYYYYYCCCCCCFFFYYRIYPIEISIGTSLALFAASVKFLWWINLLGLKLKEFIVETVMMQPSQLGVMTVASHLELVSKLACSFYYTT